ncbi:GNAT family N-acetyltransferase [Enterovibrio sp. 27052020O]|uniref:GNAT family N-acetyltransferase n=1 Tax=Enterovibrio sp. 27052020O TaxID=3241166 RepID=UPI00388E2DB6
MNGDAVASDPISTLLSLHAMAQRSYVRIPIFVRGDTDFVCSLMNVLPKVTLVSDEWDFPSRFLWRQAKQLLGQETQTLALDVREQIDVEKICAISGCIKGGELLIFIVGEEQEADINGSRFRDRFLSFSSHANAAMICQSGFISMPACRRSDPREGDVYSNNVTTHEQGKAIEAIKHVLSGHRRRPALLVADRGRGKSSAMGIAAASVMQEERKRLLVTAPTVANVETLLQHAANAPSIQRKGKYGLVADSGSELLFIAPDALLQEMPECDLLLVDEAAAIPLPMLDKILARYSRIVFSSTEHGYEGTGRGFSTRFRTLLNAKAKGWKEVRLETPVRWAAGDLLEAWLFATFLFDAEPILPKDNCELVIREISQRELSSDEKLLRQVFALLVSAHYQTSPNDLVQLLDGENQTVLVAFLDDTAVGVIVAQREGGFEQTLAQAVVDGQRRIRGHLLAQSLATHTGTLEVLTNDLFRITRVAVLPSCRQQGIGHALVAATERVATEKDISIVGTSFGVNSELWQFWSSMAYLPARLGVQRDAASGTYSLQLIKPLGQAPMWLRDVDALFSINFPYQLNEQFSDMDPTLVSRLLVSLTNVQSPDPRALKQVALFASGALGYDLVAGSLWVWSVHWLATREPHDRELEACNALIARVLQRRSWHEVATAFGYQGRKETEMAIRKWIAVQLDKKKEIE